MEYSENDKKNIISYVIKQNGLTRWDIMPLLSKQMTSSTQIRNANSYFGMPYSKAVTFFEPKVEEVDPFDISGFEYKSASFLDCLLTIYRPESIYNNLGNFDFDKFNASLDKTNFLLIEKGGKYYVHGDGNHRCMALLFAAYLQKAKLDKQNMPFFAKKMLLSKFKINVPVIHLEHDEDLMTFLNGNFYTSFGDLEQDYMNKLTGGERYRSITYDKATNTYSMNYKGFVFLGKTSDEILVKMKQIENIGCVNNLYLKNNMFTLTNEHIGVTNIPKDNVYNFDHDIENLNLPDTQFNYFIDLDCNKKTVELHISNYFYTDEIKDMEEIDNFIENHLDILRAQSIDDVYHPVNGLYKQKYENISFNEALDIIDVLHNLEKLILLKEKQINNKR